MHKGSDAGKAEAPDILGMNTNFSGLATTYLGMSLRTPLIPSASPLSSSLHNLEEMERSGAGAVVFQTLFEQPAGANAVSREDYFARISAAQKKLEIPVIASLSATTAAGWSQLGRQLEEAGADALELNIYEANVSASARPGRLSRGTLKRSSGLPGRSRSRSRSSCHRFSRTWPT